MSTLLHKKQTLLIPLLAKLRAHHPYIGACEKSRLQDNFHYNFKVANSRIEIDDDLIDYFHRTAITTVATQFRSATMRFIPIIDQNAVPVPLVTPKRYSNWVFYTLYIILLVLIASTFFQKPSEAEDLSALLAQPRPKTPEELKQELLALENSHSSTYISIKTKVGERISGGKLYWQEK